MISSPPFSGAGWPSVPADRRGGLSSTRRTHVVAGLGRRHGGAAGLVILGLVTQGPDQLPRRSVKLLPTNGKSWHGRTRPSPARGDQAAFQEKFSAWRRRFLPAGRQERRGWRGSYSPAGQNDETPGRCPGGLAELRLVRLDQADIAIFVARGSADSAPG